MIGVVAAAVLVLVARHLLAGCAIDLGPPVAAWAPAVLALSVAGGLLSRARLPWLADSVAVAVLVPARGPLSDLAGLLLPSGWVATPWIAAAVGLAPAGFALGRQLSTLVQDRIAGLLLGWCAGEALVALGVVGWLPGSLTGFAAAAVFATLVEMARLRHAQRDGAGDARPRWEALAGGFVLAVLVLSLRRLVPAYAEPPPHVGSEVALALLLPAALVAWPASALAQGERGTRALFALGVLLLAAATWTTTASLGLFRIPEALDDHTRRVIQLVARWGGPVTEWRGWLWTTFAALPAGALGLVLGACRRGAAGPLALGVGLGLLAEQWVAVSPDFGPQQLLVGAVGVAALGALATLHRGAVLLLPAAAAGWLLLPEHLHEAFDDARRVGEPVVEAFHRSLTADARLVRAAPRSVEHPQARQAFRRSFTNRQPFLALVDGELLVDGRPAAEGAAGSPAHDHALDAGDADSDRRAEPAPTHLGLRIGGAAVSPGDDPMGADGAIGRFDRVFAVRGRAFVTGATAELAAADLRDAGLAEEVVLASPVPLGRRIGLVLFDHEGSRGTPGEVRRDPVGAARAAPAGAFDTVLVAPERPEWPQSGAVLAVESLARLARLLAPAGRCLAWIDTQGLSTRALGARLAAFGDVFGERSAAFVEMRGSGAPLVLLVGWRDEAARPAADELTSRLAALPASWRRSRLSDLDDLGAHLLLDGGGVERAASRWPVHARARPVPSGQFHASGWAAVQRVLEGEPAVLSRVVRGAGGQRSRWVAGLGEGLAVHAGYRFHPEESAASMIVTIPDDVDWERFEAEAEAYARAAQADPRHPLLHFALEELLEPLARQGDYRRFAQVFEAVDGASMPSRRLALLEAWVAGKTLAEERAAQALARAAQL